MHRRAQWNKDVELRQEPLKVGDRVLSKVELCEEFERRQALVKQESFWAWLQHTDNTTHFKSKENLNFWSDRPDQHVEWLKMVWVEFGCPGHGKGPWDGLGAMAKSKVTLDIMHSKEHTSTGKITSPMLMTQHLWVIFCNKGWKMEHTDMKINQVVVMYLNDDKISQPAAPPVVAPCKGHHVMFFFLCFLVYRGTMRGGHTVVGARHARVCEVGFGIVTQGLQRLWRGS